MRSSSRVQPPPHTATVTPAQTSFIPQFDGTPTVVPVQGTSLSYVANSPTPILVLQTGQVYACSNGVWFQAVESRYGIDAAVELDTEAWRRFTVIEAKRIMQRLGLAPGGGIPALVECLKNRLYARINLQDVIEQSETRVVFRMLDCRVQSARKRKGLPAHPCKSVGIVEYTEFARAIDPRIRTRCVACPPDEHPEEYWCAWEFTLEP